MRYLTLAFIVLVSVIVINPAMARINVVEFDNPEDEARYKKFSLELRCLVCQNQNIADSDAELAQDLRRELYRMIKEGKTDEEIIDFMVARYGDFVLYRPPIKSTTAALWIGPAILFVGGIIFLIMFVRSRVSSSQEAIELSEDEKRRLDELVRKTEENK